MLNDPLAAALSKMLNAERIGRREVLIRPASKMIKKVLGLMNEQGYLVIFVQVWLPVVGGTECPI